MNRNNGKYISFILMGLIAVPTLSNVVAPQAFGAVGDVIATRDIEPIIPGVAHFCSVGLAFDGKDLYLDGCGDSLIYKVNAVTGAPDGSFASGVPELPNAMAFDSVRNGLWIGTQKCNDVGAPVYFYDFGTGTTTLKFTIPSSLINPATGLPFVGLCFNDGLAYNTSDPITGGNAIYYSDDVNKNLGIFTPSGTLALGKDSTTINPALALQSGLAIGGTNLYLGNDGGGSVFRATVPGFTPLGLFSTSNERQEDMECDPVTFAPTQVMWVRTTPQGGAFPNVVTAHEIEPNTCKTGGGDQPPNPSIPEFPFSFSLIIMFVVVAAVYLGVRQKMIPGFKSF